jgi:outer membrane protein OmpA-like peptidoglycan-associated protein
MNSKFLRVLVALAVVALLALPASAQNPQDKKLKAATLDGTTGLFKSYDAETLLKGELNFSLGIDSYNRDTNDLEIRDLPASFSVGLHDRVEFYGSWIYQRHIESDAIAYYRLIPGQAPRPAQTLTGATSFTQVAPFIDVPTANGMSDLLLGVKFNFLSERTGAPLGMGLAIFTTLPIADSNISMNRGLTSGANSGGAVLLISKRAGKIAQVHFNTGANWVSNPDWEGTNLADLQNEFIWRGGAGFPAYGRVQIIGEVSGTTYWGTRTLGLNPRTAVDIIGGVRFYPTKSITVGAGYQATINHVKDQPGIGVVPAGTNGFVAQFTMGRRINRPPAVTCQVATPTIKQADTTAVRASGTDPDRDEPLTYTWSTSGGKITGTGDAATFDATGIAPGKYTVTAVVSDGEKTATCSSEITVLKRNEAPTVRCEPTSTTATVGDSVSIKASASDPNNDQLTYTWTVNGQKLAADTPSITFGTAGRDPGDYTVKVDASDGEFTATCSTVVTVRAAPKVNRPPVIEVENAIVDVPCGETAVLRIKTSDPDGDRVQVKWAASCGTVQITDSGATFSAGGGRAGSCPITATADDGNGGTASATITANIHECLSAGFAPGSFRLDNVAKALLDDVATRMNSDPKLVANITGYTDGSKLEKSVKGLGAKRAQAMADYLVKKKGVDASRLTTNDGGTSKPIGDDKTAEGRKLNRRAVIELSVR